MKEFVLRTSFVCALAWLLATSSSVAQRPRFDAYFANPAAGATVSPYLNLGVDSAGYSNYQTFVRPLLEQRAAMARQAIAESRDQHQRGAFQSSGVGQGSRRNDTRGGRAPRRFMNYSHYFGGRD